MSEHNSIVVVDNVRPGPQKTEMVRRRSGHDRSELVTTQMSSAARSWTGTELQFLVLVEEEDGLRARKSSTGTDRH